MNKESQYLVFTAEQDVFLAAEITDDMRLRAESGLLVIVSLSEWEYCRHGQWLEVEQYENPE